MNAPTRLAAYGAGLAVLLTGGFVLGDRTDLGAVEDASATHSSAPGDGTGADHNEMNGMGGMDEEEASGATSAEVPGGLQVAEGGYTFELPATGYRAGTQSVSFRILGPDGTAVTDYEESHEKGLHLIAVRRDFADFQHVHPTLDSATGTWSVDVDFAPGTWRLFADFVPAGGEALTLGSDVLVAGNPGDQKLPQPVKTATVDGYTVTVTGDLAAGEHSMLDFEVTKDGQPVTDLEPYLGAYGHLVALREGDLAYLHVHPGGEPGDGVTEPGPIVEFGAEVPSAGRYQLFLDFKADGVVRTAAFTLDASRSTTPTDQPADESAGGDSDSNSDSGADDGSSDGGEGTGEEHGH